MPHFKRICPVYSHNPQQNLYRTSISRSGRNCSGRLHSKNILSEILRKNKAEVIDIWLLNRI